MPWWPCFLVLHSLPVRTVGTRLRKSVTPSFRTRSYFSACLRSFLSLLLVPSRGSVTAPLDPWLAPYCYPFCPVARSLLIIALTGVCRGAGPFRSLPAGLPRRPLVGPLSPVDLFPGMAAVAACAVAVPGGRRGFMPAASAPWGMQFFRPFFRRTYGSLLRNTTGLRPCWLMRLSLRFASRPAAGLRPRT